MSYKETIPAYRDEHGVTHSITVRNEPAPALPTPKMGPAEVREAKEAQRLLDAKIVLAEEAVKQLFVEKRAIEDSLWMPVTKSQLTALLKEGTYGRSLDVQSDVHLYRHRSSAYLNDAGELIIGGYHRNDHFRADILYIRKDFGRY